LLNKFSEHFGVKFVEGKQLVEGSSTNWTIDAKGVCEKGEGIIIVECRRYTTSKLNQEQVGALAYRIQDTKAKGGILVSPLGFQEGAARVAKSNKILEVLLDENSTETGFVIKFLDKMFLGIGIQNTVNVSDTITVKIFRKCNICGNNFEVVVDETVCNDCI
jgi:hypothetical protein